MELEFIAIEFASHRAICGRPALRFCSRWFASSCFLLSPALRGWYTAKSSQVHFKFTALMIHTPTDLSITKSKRGALDPGHYRSNIRCLTLRWEHGTPNHTCRNTYIYIYYNVIQQDLHHISLHYITLRYIALHYTTLHYVTLHYTTLHYIRYITLHTLHTYITYIH